MSRVSELRSLLLARHGETDWNLAGRWQGTTDVPLNRTGLEQAAALAARLVGRDLRTVVASDLDRARRTAEIVSAALGLAPPLCEPGLRERSYGLFEGLTRAQCAVQHPAAWQAFGEGREPPGAEPRAEVGARMVETLTRLARTHEGLLVISHGGALRAFFDLATGVKVPPITNVAVYEVRLAAAGFVDPRLL